MRADKIPVSWMSVLYSAAFDTSDAIEDIRECFEWKEEILKAISFIPFGFGSTVCNILLTAAILSSRSLRDRSEMRIICALSFAELVEAVATLLGGIYRTSVILTDRVYSNFTPLDCMLLPHSWMWRWSDFATSFMLLCLTLDRLLSVMIPLRYITFGVSYSTIVIGTAYSTSALLSLFAWYHPLMMHAHLSMLCMNVYLSPTFYALSKYTTSLATILSVVLYLPVVYLTRKQLQSMTNKLNVTQTDHKRRAQLHMTVTIAIQCLATLFLDAIPRAVGIYGTAKMMTESRSQCESRMMMLFHLTKVNSMIALALYYWRNKIIHESIDTILWRRKKSHSTAAYASVMPTPTIQILAATNAATSRRRVTTILPVHPLADRRNSNIRRCCPDA